MMDGWLCLQRAYRALSDCQIRAQCAIPVMQNVWRWCMWSPIEARTGRWMTSRKFAMMSKHCHPITLFCQSKSKFPIFHAIHACKFGHLSHQLKTRQYNKNRIHIISRWRLHWNIRLLFLWSQGLHDIVISHLYARDKSSPCIRSSSANAPALSGWPLRESSK